VGEGGGGVAYSGCRALGIPALGVRTITAEAADVVYLGHSLEKLPKLLKVSRAAV